MALIELDAPGLAKMTAQVAALLKQDATLRALQAANAAIAFAFDQPGVFGPFAALPITGAQHYNILEARQQPNLNASALLLIFESASGAARYRIDGSPATPTVGTEVPAGGIVIKIEGWDNIRNFDLVAQAAATVTFTRYLLR